MSQTITIDPVTRIEGHGKITIQLDAQGEVEDAHFHVTQVRGFEKFSQGRPFYEMPAHDGAHLRHLPGLPPAGVGQGLRSHHVGAHSAHRRAAAPRDEPGADRAVARAELLPSVVSRPAARHGVGPGAAAHLRRRGGKPELGRAGIGLRRFGQQIIELLGSKRIHTGWVVPGGVTEPLSAAKRDEMLAMLPEAYANVSLALAAYKQIADRFQQEISVFANFPSSYLGLINEDESIEFTDGALRLIGPKGDIIEDGITAQRFTEVIGEAVETLQLYEVRLLQAARVSRGQLSRRPAGTAEHRQDDGDAEGRPGTGRVQAARCRAGGELVLLSPCAAGRGALRHREDRAAFLPIRRSSTSTCAQPPASTVWKAQGRSKRRAAR